MAKADFICKERVQRDDILIKKALKALKRQLKKPKTKPISSPRAAKNYLTLELAREETETFCVMYMDAQSRLIEFERLTRGTLMQAYVHPREVARGALRYNAASVILAHNHPSGCELQSQADEELTNTIKQTLAVFEVKVLDHIIVAGEKTMSFAEHGLI